MEVVKVMNVREVVMMEEVVVVVVKTHTHTHRHTYVWLCVRKEGC